MNTRTGAYQDMDKFDETLRRMGMDTASKVQQEIGNEAQQIKQHMEEQNEVPYVHLEKLAARSQPQLAALKASSDVYMTKIKQRKGEEIAARKEREKRRQKMLLEQQKGYQDIDEKRRQEIMLVKLQRLSRQERAIAQGLSSKAQWKDVFMQHKLEREKQYNERRRRDYEEDMERNREKAAREHEQYLKEVELENMKYKEVKAEKERNKKEKHVSIAREVAGQFVELAMKVVSYCEHTDELGTLVYRKQMVPLHLWRNWIKVFLSGDDLGAQRDAVETEQIAPAIDEETEQEGNPTATVKLRAQGKPENENVLKMLDSAELRDYLLLRNEWTTDIFSPVGAELNGTVVQAMNKIQKVLSPPNPVFKPKPTPKIQVVIMGKTMSGKSVAAERVAKELGLVYISATTLVDEAIQNVADIDHNQLATMPEEMKDLVVSRVQTGREIRSILFDGGEVSEDIVVTLLLNKLKLFNLQPNNDKMGVVMDGIPSTVEGFKRLEKYLSDYDESLKISIDGKLLLTCAPTAPPTGANRINTSSTRSPTAGMGVVPRSGTGGNVSLFSPPATADRPLSNYTAMSSEAGEGVGVSASLDFYQDGGAIPPPTDPNNLPITFLGQPPNPDGDESGIEKIIHVDITNRSVFSRYAGQRVDPQTGGLYHLEFNPPPYDRIALLEPVSRPSLGDQQLLHTKLMQYAHEHKRITAWAEKYGNLVTVDGEQSIETVTNAVVKLVEQTISDKHVKYNNTITDDNTSKAKGSTPTPSKNSAAPTAATGLCLIPNLEESQVTAEWVQSREALMDKDLAELLEKQWDGIECVFVEATQQVFRSVRGLAKLAIQHFVIVQNQFKTFLLKPDNKQNLLDEFQEQFNTFDEYLRSDVDAKGELHMRADQFQESLWKISDLKRDTGKDEIQAYIEDEWIDLHHKSVKKQFVHLMQMEVNRFIQTRQWLIDYYSAICGIDNSGDEPLPTIDVVSRGSDDDEPKGKKGKDTKQKAGGAPPKDSKQKAPKGKEKGKPEDKEEEEDLLQTATEHILLFLQTPFPEGDEAQQQEEDRGRLKDKAKRKKQEEEEKTTRVVPPIMRAAIETEGALCQVRIRRIAAKCGEVIDETKERADNVFTKMSKQLTARYKTEMQSVAGVMQVIRRAIEEQNALPYELQLNGTSVVINKDVLVVEPTQKVSLPEKPQTDDFDLLTAYLTKKQCVQLTKHLRRVSPTGLVSCQDFVRLFLQLVASSYGKEYVPPYWRNFTQENFEYAFQCFDITQRGTADWREFLLSLLLWSNPRLPAIGDPDVDSKADLADHQNPYCVRTPSLTELVELKGAFDILNQQNASSDEHPVLQQCARLNRVTQDQFMQVQFWFNKLTNDEKRSNHIKTILWRIFHEPASSDQQQPETESLPVDTLHYHTLLLFLSSDSQIVRGVQKAFAVLSHSTDRKLTLPQMYEAFHFNATMTKEDEANDDWGYEQISTAWQEFKLTHPDTPDDGEPAMSFQNVCSTHVGRVMLNNAKIFMKKAIHFCPP